MAKDFAKMVPAKRSTTGAMAPLEKEHLGPITRVPIARIMANPKNKIMPAMDAESFEALRADIATNGINVPLILKRDNVLLAGENRLRAAQAIGLKTVPAQYFLGELNDQAETEFLIKDNLLRRHLTSESRIELYKKFFPGLAKSLLSENRGRTSEAPTVVQRVTAKAISEKTGVKKSTVEKDLTAMRKKKVISKATPAEKRAVTIDELKNERSGLLVKIGHMKNRIKEIDAALEKIK